MTRDELRAALQHPNVRAFLRVIREGESSQDERAYRMRYGGALLDDLSAHPRTAVSAAGYTSTAAGAYQFLARTWDGLVRRYGFEDFGPACQDEAAVALIHGRKSLGALMDGDLATTLERCSWEWASLPPPRYGQRTLSAERVYATYDRYGGRYGPQPDAPADQAGAGAAIVAPLVSTPSPDPGGAPMPFPALALAALPALIESLPSLIRIFGKGERSQQNAQTAEKVVEVVKAATGSDSIEEALGKITGDPAARQAADDAVKGAFYSLTEAGGGGIDGAREFNVAAAKERFWHMPAFWISLALLPLLYGTVYVVLTTAGGEFSGELKAAIASSVVTGILGAVAGFWLGSSFTTSRSRGLGATPTTSP